MDAELSLVVGLVLLVFSIPAIVSAFSDRRTPRVAIIVLMAGGGLIIWALQNMPGGLRIEDIPEIFVRVVGRFI